MTVRHPTVSTVSDPGARLLHFGKSSSSYLQRAQRRYREQNPQNVEPHHHLRLVPTFLLEVMMDRSHQKNPPPHSVPPSRVPEPTCLQNHRARFHHEHSAR